MVGITRSKVIFLRGVQTTNQIHLRNTSLLPHRWPGSISCWGTTRWGLNLSWDGGTNPNGSLRVVSPSLLKIGLRGPGVKLSVLFVALKYLKYIMHGRWTIIINNPMLPSSKLYNMMVEPQCFLAQPTHWMVRSTQIAIFICGIPRVYQFLVVKCPYFPWSKNKKYSLNPKSVDTSIPMFAGEKSCQIMCQIMSDHFFNPLVGGLEHFLFSHILGIIIPID